MRVYNRVPLPHDEHARLETLQEKVLKALQTGRQSNKKLSLISLDYGRNIRSLRNKGHTIHCEKLKKGGLRYYYLADDPDPEWSVVGKVTLADGRVFQQTIIVRADNMPTARNRAQHKFSKVKILSAQPRRAGRFWPYQIKQTIKRERL